MLVEINDKIISTEIFKKQFVCDLNACKGACCVEGDQGAPITFDEVKQLEASLDKVLPYMRPEGIEAVEKSGVSYLDDYGHPATTLVNNAECAFVFFEEGIAKCSIEKAYREKQIDFNKPLSCHLYPIRVKKFSEYAALNVEDWHICSPACACGEQLKVPVFRFLKEPLIRGFGEEFYKELEIVEKELIQNSL